MADITSDIEITKVNGSLGRGGWQLDFTSLLDTDLLDVHQQVNVSWRGGFGGPPGVLRAAFTGYVQPNRFEFDRVGSRSNYVAQTSDGFLRRGWCQGIGFAEVTTRAHYHQFSTVGAATPDMDNWMTSGKLVRHILGYYDDEGAPPATNPDWVAHTNMVFHPVHNPNGWISLDNVELEGSVHLPDAYIVRETDNLWERLREIAENEFYLLVFDKNDVLWYNLHPMYEAVLPTPVMTFDSDFMLAAPRVELRDVEQVRQVILHAVTDDSDTLHAEFPSSPTFVYGTTEEIGRLRCNSQALLDDWAERHYYWLNRPYTVRVQAAGMCGLLFEIADRVQITYTGTAANGVHIDWTEEKFWIDEITCTPGEGFSGVTEFVLEAENPIP